MAYGTNSAQTASPVYNREVASPSPPQGVFVCHLKAHRDSSERAFNLGQRLNEFADRLGAPHIPRNPAPSGEVKDAPPPSIAQEYAYANNAMHNNLDGIAYAIERLMQMA